MTDSNFCCLCASDEGVFLDIFETDSNRLGNRSFLQELENCLSFQVDKSEALSSKICHKCAIELGECNQFVTKYQQAFKNASRTKKSKLKKSCCLCFDAAPNRCLFSLAKDFRSTINCIQKIQECFTKQITLEQAESKLICLFCRYNLDVLYDLKQLAREVRPKLQKIAESRAVLANLPKTKTFVVNRKTTVVHNSKIELQTPSDSESEYDTMTHRQLRSTKFENLKSSMESKLRVCEQCQTAIKGGIDMYRLHKIGITVCKMCWITTEPSKITKKNNCNGKTESRPKNTKPCTVILRDVLSIPPLKDDNTPSQVEIDERGDPIYYISDESSDEKKLNIGSERILRQRRVRNVISSDQEHSRPQIKRFLNIADLDSDSKSNKKLKTTKNTTKTVFHTLKSFRSYSSDSDAVNAKKKQSDVSEVKKPKSPKKSTDTHFEVEVNKMKADENIRKRKRAGVVSKGKDAIEMSSSHSDDSGLVGKSRKVRTQDLLTLKPNLPSSPKVEKNRRNVKAKTASPNLNENLKRTVRKQLPVQSFATGSPTTKLKLSPKRTKTKMTVNFPFKIKLPYECKVCRTKYKNKVIGMTHEMTHFKQLEITLPKLDVAHYLQTLNETSTTSKNFQASLVEGCSLDSSRINEEASEQEKSLVSVIEDCSDKSGCETIEEEEKEAETDKEKTGESAQSSKKLETLEETDGIKDSAMNNSHDKTIDNIEAELDLENVEDLDKTEIFDSNTEDQQLKVNSVVESNKKDDNDASMEELGNTIEEKKLTGHENDNDIISDKEIENDTDIQIVDTGGSAEKSELTKNDVLILKDTKDTDNEPLSTELSKSILNDESVAVTCPETDVDNSLIDNEQADVTSQNEEQIKTKDVPNCTISESRNEISDFDKENREHSLASVTEILQEVLELATAEVQKRTENDEISLPETLEDISEEIKKTASQKSGSIEAEINES